MRCYGADAGDVGRRARGFCWGVPLLLLLLPLVGCGTDSGGGADALGDAAAPDAASGDATSGDLPAGDLGPADAAGDAGVAADAVEVDAGPPPEPPAPADCQPCNDPFPVRPEPLDPPTLPFLRVEGTQILDEAGQPVALRGINFGSWLQMETWLSGLGLQSEAELIETMIEKSREFGVAALFSRARGQTALEWLIYTRPHYACVQDWRAYCYANATPEEQPGVDQLFAWFDEQPWVYEERMLWRYLEKRFGHARTQELRQVFLDNFITELDVERLAALGLNLIRLPVFYQALETDVEGENHFVADGWRRLDELVSWARRHGVYVMIDLHGAPGGQNPWWHTGIENGGFLWTTPACIDKTARLWQAIAQYFRDEPHVAVYDFLNEPNSAPDAERYEATYDAIYRAVREVDTRHIVMVEDGFLASSIYRSPAEMGWQNAMASFHHYPGGTSAQVFLNRMDAAMVGLGRQWERFDCPLFEGEFNVYAPTDFSATDQGPERWQPDGMDRVLAMLNRRGVHWAPWTYKYFHAPSLWGLYHQPNPGERIDLQNLSFEQLREAFAALHSQNYLIDEAYGDLLQRNGAAAVSTLDLSETPAPEP